MRVAWLCALLVGAAHAEEPTETFRFDLGLTFTRFEQQVKSQIGGARGERLVEETRFGVNALASYTVWGPLSVGGFAWLDVGHRSAGRFGGFDHRTGGAVVAGSVGGDFAEVWIGPMVRARWRMVFVELGYGAFGLRSDDARDDLPDADGDIDSALRTSPTVAWRLALGGHVPLVAPIELALRMEYRVRYYDRRAASLRDDVAHGTQEYTPFVGISWPL